jgi:hypothetical protein
VGGPGDQKDWTLGEWYNTLTATPPPAASNPPVAPSSGAQGIFLLVMKKSKVNFNYSFNLKKGSLLVPEKWDTAYSKLLKYCFELLKYISAIFPQPIIPTFIILTQL